MVSLARRKWTLANVAWPYGSDGAMMIDDDDCRRPVLDITVDLERKPKGRRRTRLFMLKRDCEGIMRPMALQRRMIVIT